MDLPLTAGGYSCRTSPRAVAAPKCAWQPPFRDLDAKQYFLGSGNLLLRYCEVSAQPGGCMFQPGRGELADRRV